MRKETGMRTRNLVLPALAALTLAACSQETQDNAALTAERAAEDAEANLDVIGEEIEDGAAAAAENVSEGAARLGENIRAGDEEEPGPAPITGQDLSDGVGEQGGAS